MIEIEFSKIDAKEGDIIEVYGETTSKHNLRVIKQATFDYLKRLSELQDEIEQQIKSNLTDVEEKISERELWDYTDELDKEFDTNKYDHTWYS